MFVRKPSGKRASVRVYTSVLAACCLVLGLAGLLLHFKPGSADPSPGPGYAEARGEWRISGLTRWLRIAALPLERKSSHVTASKPALIPQTPVPVLISRAPDDGKTGSAVASVSESPDTDDGLTGDKWAPGRSDTYRTVCVRLCDGAFFPISFATTRDRFKTDAARCKASCGSPSKLFVGPPDGSMDELTDVKGNAYGDLENAFKFRVSYDAACTCKAQPWEVAELNRHKGLAEAARIAALSPQKPVEQTIAAKPAPAPGSLSTSLQIAALNPAHAPAVLASRELAGVKAAAAASGDARSSSIAAVSMGLDATERKKQAHRTSGSAKGSAKLAAHKKAGAKAVVTVMPKADIFRIVFGPKLKKAGSSQVADTSMQRPFKPKEYWRLSYWDVTN